ncbi:uncharacterized protein LOC131329685 [Rhododendron vialii]|uniref:uncharacterized protein LOC131329685 n=1 Tax=Rhododendron vialii TaxID=182163 RepID=UPI00265F66C1|nr:uncharacterized protein LOC131329685 [Rhododendron vialii]
MSSGPSMTSDHASSHAPSMTSAPAKSDDPAWAYAKLVLGKKNNTICLFCNKHLKGGGITRLKQHLAGVKGEVEACKNVSMDVKWQMNQMLEGYKQDKERRERISKVVGEGASYQALDQEEEESLLDRTTSGDGTKKKKRSKTIGGIFAPRTTLGAQPSIQSALSSKQTIDEARIAVARWWYDANIPFNATLSSYYQLAIDAMVAVGPGFMGPSYHDLRCPLLNNSVHEIREYLLELRESIDTSGLVKDADTLFGIFCEIVELVGPSNVVQFVTDNEAAYKAVGKRLQAHYGSFYWSPCAAHCLDLMLENFAKPQHFPHIDATIQKAKKVTRYIYSHAWVLNTMRKDFTNGRDLCCPSIISDDDEMPVMGYLYDAMDKAKKAIKVRFNNRLSLYGPYIQVIDPRWDRQLHSPLHVTVLVPDEHLQDQISAQIEEYKQATGDFNMPLAIRQREKLSPVSWWRQFGGLVQDLQKFAIQELSQCCSATGCERNWSMFEVIYSKKRNRLEHKRLNDLVYVRYNLKLRESLENIDMLDDWVSEEPSLLDEEDIAWEIIEPPSLEALTLDDQEPNFDDAADDFPNENESHMPGESSANSSQVLYTFQVKNDLILKINQEFDNLEDVQNFYNNYGK